jgi:putative selenate reductase FAD-binding subunit
MISEFFKPETIEEALALKEKYGDKIAYLGGGTKINNTEKEPHPTMVISLERLNFKDISKKGAHLHIGAGVTLQELIDSPKIPEPLRLSAGHTPSRNIRNMATVGGDVGSGSSDASLVPCLMALGAQLETAPRGNLNMETYLAGSRRDLITAVQVPVETPPCVVERISQHVCGPALISVAVACRGKPKGTSTLSIVVGTVKDRVIRLKAVEEGINDGSLSSVEAIQEAVSEQVFPDGEDDQSLNYRRYLCGVVVADCILRCQNL